jgi:hypothetical protein
MSARDGGADAPMNALLSASPSELGERLVLWLDGSFNIVHPNGGGVTIWVDRSPYGNDAVSTTKPPSLGLVQGSKTLLAVLFDGHSFLTIPDAPALQWGTDDYTIEVVAAYTKEAGPTYAGHACLYEKTSIVSPFYGVSFTGNGALANDAGSPVVSGISSSVESEADAGVANVTGKTTGVSAPAFHVFGTRRTAIHTLEVRLDGASDGINSNVDSADVSAVGRPVNIGGVPAASDEVIDALSGSIAEIIAVHGPVSDVELARLEGYLKQKYGL